MKHDLIARLRASRSALRSPDKRHKVSAMTQDVFKLQPYTLKKKWIVNCCMQASYWDAAE